MLRVGQRHIAWTAYERASRMAERFWPDPALQQALRDHCRRRQAQIEATLLAEPTPPGRRPGWRHVSPPPSKATVAHLRTQFEAELAYGEGFQRAYQQAEAAKVAAGVPIDDEHIFDEFHARRRSIASPVGLEEWFSRVPQAKMAKYASESAMAWGLFGAGMAAVGMALLSRRSGRNSSVMARSETGDPANVGPSPPAISNAD